jgi:hypothetical protein
VEIIDGTGQTFYIPISSICSACNNYSQAVAPALMLPVGDPHWNMQMQSNPARQDYGGWYNPHEAEDDDWNDCL